MKGRGVSGNSRLTVNLIKGLVSPVEVSTTKGSGTAVLTAVPAEKSKVGNGLL